MGKRLLFLMMSFHLFIQGFCGRVPLIYRGAETVYASDTADDSTKDRGSDEEKTTLPDIEKEQSDNPIEISAPSACLMEASTGKVIYVKNANEKRPPASVTKVMTLLLIFDALDSGKIHLEDPVTVSEYAASMGGSQVFLEAGEIQTVETMIKCISVASGNDACVAISEYISGSEEQFVEQMNSRAKELGMADTHFVNCNGLDAEGHVTTAQDIALMSQELITKYPEIYKYCNIWMENITHTTKKGSSEFGLTNTNKMIRNYEYATGLKTGSTSQARFCISATARKNNIDLIAVIMAADDSKSRMRDAIALLNYGFGICTKYSEDQVPVIPDAEVTGGMQDTIKVLQKIPFAYVDTAGADLGEIERRVIMKNRIPAPVKSGEQVGEVQYYLHGHQVGKVAIIAGETIDKATYLHELQLVGCRFLL